MESSLFQNIHDIGQEAYSALSVADLERFFVLLNKRGTLLERLFEHKHPSSVDQDWRSHSVALLEQQQLLTDALEATERRAQDMLTALERFKGASRTYQRTTPRSQILNKDLRI